DDLDVGRAVRDRPCGGRRHLGAVVDDDACHRDPAPDAEHEAPVEQTAEDRKQPAPAAITATTARFCLGGFAFCCGFAICRHDAILLADRNAVGGFRPRRALEAWFDATVSAVRHALCLSVPGADGARVAE